MHNCKMPHVIFLLNLEVIAWLQHSMFTKALSRFLWSSKSSRSTVFLKTHDFEYQIKCTLVKIPSISFNHFVWATRKRTTMERCWDLQRICPIFGYGTLPTTVLTLIEIDDAWSRIEIQDTSGSKQTHDSSSETAELKHSLLHKSTTFSASRLLYCFSMSARTGPTR